MHLALDVRFLACFVFTAGVALPLSMKDTAAWRPPPVLSCYACVTPMSTLPDVLSICCIHGSSGPIIERDCGCKHCPKVLLCITKRVLCLGTFVFLVWCSLWCRTCQLPGTELTPEHGSFGAQNDVCGRSANCSSSFSASCSHERTHSPYS